MALSSPFQKIVDLTTLKERIVLGAMSGTSVDSIAVAVCAIRGTGVAPDTSVKLLSLSQKRYPEWVRQKLLVPRDLTVREVAELNVHVAESFGAACLGALKRAGLSPKRAHLIGSHGQTIYHHSRVKGATRTTLQIGDGDHIARITQIPVFSDFRMRDIAAGGEGAPLTPYSDGVMFGGGFTRGIQRIVLNLGGMANITVLSKNPFKIIGFDTGPANAPLDRLARILSKGKLQCDRDGIFANNGTVDQKLLAKLLKEDTYLKRPPPKSTGVEAYGDPFIKRLVDEYGPPTDDMIATVTAFCAEGIVGSIRRFVTKNLGSVELVIAGGGANNPALVRELRARLAPGIVKDSDEFGVPAEAREAMAFALFANEALFGTAVSYPSITGVEKPAVLGKLSMA